MRHTLLDDVLPPPAARVLTVTAAHWGLQPCIARRPPLARTTRVARHGVPATRPAGLGWAMAWRMAI